MSTISLEKQTISRLRLGIFTFSRKEEEEKGFQHE